jgi:hypothetical protein
MPGCSAWVVRRLPLPLYKLPSLLLHLLLLFLSLLGSRAVLVAVWGCIAAVGRAIGRCEPQCLAHRVFPVSPVPLVYPAALELSCVSLLLAQDVCVMVMCAVVATV